MSIICTDKEPVPSLIPFGCGDNAFRKSSPIKHPKILSVVKPQSPLLHRRILFTSPNVYLKRTRSDTVKSSFLCERFSGIGNSPRTIHGSLENLCMKYEEKGDKVQKKKGTDIMKKLLLPEEVAGRKICHALLLNAFRKRREENLLLHNNIEFLGSQIEQLQLQIMVLRRLLDTEKGRVTDAMMNFHKMKTKIEEILQEKEEMKKVKMHVDKELQKSKDKLSEARINCENLKNEIGLIKGDRDALEKQLGKERQKLTKVREDKKFLLDKVEVMEETVTMKTAALEELETLSKELEKKIEGLEVEKSENAQALMKLQDEHGILLTEQEKIEKKVKIMLEEKNKLMKEVACEEENCLEDKIQKMHVELKNSRVQNKQLEKSLHDSLVENLNLQSRLNYLEMVNRNGEASFISQLIHLILGFIRIPIAILQSMLFLLLPSNPRTSQ